MIQPKDIDLKGLNLPENVTKSEVNKMKKIKIIQEGDDESKEKCSECGSIGVGNCPHI